MIRRQGLHKIHSARYDAKKGEMKLYTSCGRIVISASDAGIIIAARCHKSRGMLDVKRWQTAQTAKENTDELVMVAKRNSSDVRVSH